MINNKSGYVRRLRRFKDVIRERGPTPIEHHAQREPVTNLQYYLMAVDIDDDDDEKVKQLEKLAEVVTGVRNSDVFVVAMWIG
jgi:hypothetical protein